MRQVTTEGSRSSPFQVWRSMNGGSTSSTSQSTMPFQPGTGLPTNLKWFPTSTAYRQVVLQQGRAGDPGTGQGAHGCDRPL
jgi:hypothetical protein